MLVKKLTMVLVASAAVGCAGDDGGGGDDAETTSATVTMTSAPATSQTASTSGSPTSATSTADTTSSGSTGSADGSTSAESSGGAQTIPDPGAGMDSWIATGDVSTPGTAWPVGIATMSPGYIEADAPEGNGNAFWVFEAGPALTEFTASAVAFTNPIDFTHLHDGTGLLFGDELAATSSMPCCGGDGIAATWDVNPGSVYVFEVHVPGGATV